MADENKGDPLRTFIPGQTWEPDAATLNAWNEAAKALRGDAGGTSDVAGFFPGAKVTVKNNSGVNRARGEVLELQEPLFLPSSHEHVVREVPRFKGIEPTDDYKDVAVLLEPIPDGKLGPALVAGLCWAKVKIGNANDYYAHSVDGETYLESSPCVGNARILWPHATQNPAGWALVIIGIRPAGAFMGTIESEWSTGEHDVKPWDMQGSTVKAQPTWTGITCPSGTPFVVTFHQQAGKYYAMPFGPYESQIVITNIVDTDTDIIGKKRTLKGIFVTEEENGPNIETTECE